MNLKWVKPTVLLLFLSFLFVQQWQSPPPAYAIPCDPVRDDDCDFDPVPTPAAPAVGLQIVDREVESLTVRWSGINLEGQVGHLLQRRSNGGSWTTIAGSRSQLISGNRFVDGGLPSGEEFCYRVTVYLPSTSVTSNEKCESTKLPPVDTDDFPVWRLQARFVTGNIGDADTDDDILVKLNGQNGTWVDYGRDDFEKGDTFTYDLLPVDVGTIGQIDRFEISKNGTNGWCVDEFTLLVNENPIYHHDFGVSCHWLDNDNSHSRTFSVDGDTMRSHELWEQFSQPIPSFIMPRIEIESRIESVVGHFIKGEKLFWGDLHGRAVEISKAAGNDNQTIHLDLDLSYDLPGPFNPEVDVDMDIRYSCQNEVVTINILNAEIEVLGYDKEIDVGPISHDISDILQTANEVWQAELIFGKKLTCVQIFVQPDGSILFELEFEEEETPLIFQPLIRPLLFTTVDGQLEVFSQTVSSGVISDITFAPNGTGTDVNPPDQQGEIPVDDKALTGEEDAGTDQPVDREDDSGDNPGENPDTDQPVGDDENTNDDGSEEQSTDRPVDDSDGNEDENGNEDEINGQTSSSIFLPFVSQ